MMIALIAFRTDHADDGRSNINLCSDTKSELGTLHFQEDC
jgi:hypothetical protein